LKPQWIFFDAGLVLLSPSKTQVFDNLKCFGLESEGKVELAYRKTIYDRDTHNYSGSFNFWAHWCSNAGLNPSNFREVESTIIEIENSDEKLWNTMDPNLPEVLIRIKNEGVNMGIISNADGELLKDLKRHAILKYFDTVIDSEIVGVQKPDHEIFKIALEVSGVEVKDSWMIGGGCKTKCVTAFLNMRS